MFGNECRQLGRRIGAKCREWYRLYGVGFEGMILDRDVREMGLEGNKSAGRSDYVLWSMERATEEVTA